MSSGIIDPMLWQITLEVLRVNFLIYFRNYLDFSENMLNMMIRYIFGVSISKIQKVN